LLSGLAAIYFAYPPEFSFHPGAAGTSLESLRLPHFYSEKIGPFRNIANSITERKLKRAKNKGKMKISSGDCGFSGQKHRFLSCAILLFHFSPGDLQLCPQSGTIWKRKSLLL
jgi:hypothetical protein